MVNWSAFDPREYEISFNDDKLAVHDITRWDVMEVLWNGISTTRDKRYRIGTVCEGGRMPVSRWN